MTTNIVGDKSHIGLDSTDYKINIFSDNNLQNYTSSSDITKDSENPVNVETNSKQSDLEQTFAKPQDLSCPVNASIELKTYDEVFFDSISDGINKNDIENGNQIDNDMINPLPEKTKKVEDETCTAVEHTHLRKNYSSNVSELDDIIIPETTSIADSTLPPSNLVDHTLAINNSPYSEIDHLLNMDLEQILCLGTNTEVKRSHNNKSEYNVSQGNECVTETIIESTKNYCIASSLVSNNNSELNITISNSVHDSNLEDLKESFDLETEKLDDDISTSTDNNNTRSNESKSFGIAPTQASNLGNVTEKNFANVESIDILCTQENVLKIESINALSEKDNIPSFVSTSDELNKNHRIILETSNMLEIGANETQNSPKNEIKYKDQNPLEAILADFHTNKAKAVSNNMMPMNKEKNFTQFEPKFPRTHKEIITPDFGNIVKNVHGIFSSVSGSLMNAYNISHRPNTNYNMLKYGGNPKKEEKTTNGMIITDNSKSSGHSCENGDRNTLKTTFKSEDASSKSSISSPESNNHDENHTINYLDSESEPNCPINNVGILKQNSSDPYESLTPNNDDGNNIDVYRLQIQSLETSLAEQRKEVGSLRDRVKQQGDELLNKDHICKDMETKMDMMRKRVERAERDADASVMRYATSERAVLEARSSADNAKKAEKQAVLEADLLNGKLRSAYAEKARICRLLDDKIHELGQSERELNKLREETRATDTKLKFTQNKLKTEMDAYKESTAQVEKLTEQLTELQSRVENTEANAQDSIRAKELESQLQQSQASLILERHERERAETKLKQITSQAEVSSADLARNNKEIEELRSQVEKLSANNEELQEEAAELATLRARAALSDALATQLQSERERALRAEEARAGAEARGAAAALREGKALEHAAKVTAEHVSAQARAHQHEAKSLALAADNVSLRDRLSFLESEVTRLQAEHSAEAARRRQQTEALSTRVTELEQEVEDARRKLEWEVGESAVLRRKHASATKELNRELQRSLKRCQHLESRYSTAEEKPGHKRAGSITSINSLETNANCQSSSDESRVNGHTTAQTEEPSPEYQSEGPSRQMLIERVVDLQRAAARRAERCDFLEEHTRALTAELRNKSRLLRHLAAAQPSGALDTPQRDRHRTNNEKNSKSDVARKGGGAMAAVYGGDTDGLTLELSLEMNQKLQAVLEDALLKNITLRENMDTLGAEIARLKSGQHSDIR